jgi:hypothetical protein
MVGIAALMRWRQLPHLGLKPYGLSLPEASSSNVIEQFAQNKLVPVPGSPERLRYRYWLHYAEGSAMPPLLLKFLFDRMANAGTSREGRKIKER